MTASSSCFVIYNTDLYGLHYCHVLRTGGVSLVTPLWRRPKQHRTDTHVRYDEALPTSSVASLGKPQPWRTGATNPAELEGPTLVEKAPRVVVGGRGTAGKGAPARRVA